MLAVVCLLFLHVGAVCYPPVNVVISLKGTEVTLTIQPNASQSIAAYHDIFLVRPFVQLLGSVEQTFISNQPQNVNFLKELLPNSRHVLSVRTCCADNSSCSSALQLSVNTTTHLSLPVNLPSAPRVIQAVATPSGFNVSWELPALFGDADFEEFTAYCQRRLHHIPFANSTATTVFVPCIYSPSAIPLVCVSLVTQYGSSKQSCIFRSWSGQVSPPLLTYIAAPLPTQNFSLDQVGAYLVISWIPDLSVFYYNIIAENSSFAMHVTSVVPNGSTPLSVSLELSPDQAYNISLESCQVSCSRSSATVQSPSSSILKLPYPFVLDSLRSNALIRISISEFETPADFNIGWRLIDSTEGWNTTTLDAQPSPGFTIQAFPESEYLVCVFPTNFNTQYTPRTQCLVVATSIDFCAIVTCFAPPPGFTPPVCSALLVADYALNQWQCLSTCSGFFFFGVCLPCPNNTQQDLQIQKCIIPAPCASHDVPVAGGNCALCNPGTFGLANQCISCPFGTGSSMYGTSFCSVCEGSTMSVNGMCQPCPAYYFKVKFNCSTVCPLGSTVHSSKSDPTALSCDPCPTGQIGFINSAGISLCSPCLNPQACTQEGLTQCSLNFVGGACEACAANFFPQGAKCAACPSQASSIGALVMAVIFLLGFFALKAAGALPFEICVKLITYLLMMVQKLSLIVLRFGIPWPEWMRDAYRQLSVMVVLDENILAIDCITPLDFESKWAIFMFFPFYVSVFAYFFVVFLKCTGRELPTPRGMWIAYWLKTMKTFLTAYLQVILWPASRPDQFGYGPMIFCYVCLVLVLYYFFLIVPTTRSPTAESTNTVDIVSWELGEEYRHDQHIQPKGQWLEIDEDPDKNDCWCPKVVLTVVFGVLWSIIWLPLVSSFAWEAQEILVTTLLVALAVFAPGSAVSIAAFVCYSYQMLSMFVLLQRHFGKFGKLSAPNGNLKWKEDFRLLNGFNILATSTVWLHALVGFVFAVVPNPSATDVGAGFCFTFVILTFVSAAACGVTVFSFFRDRVLPHLKSNLP